MGPKELELIAQSGYRRFPPRLPEQPIFYPVLDEEYATRIARDWNVKASGSGFVTRFAVDGAFVDQFPVHQVGGRMCRELWVPAEQLETFNDHIVGVIEITARFGEEA